MAISGRKGLLKKEWQMMKWGLLALLFVNVIVVVVGPILINRAFNLPLNSFDNTMVLTGVWIVANLFIGVGIFITSLEQEMKQQVVWLHSPASMMELVGVKVVFALGVTVVLLVLTSGLLGFSFLLSDALGIIPKREGSLALLSVILSILLTTIHWMAISFFVWTVYWVTRSRQGYLSMTVYVMLFIGGITVGGAISNAAFNLPFIQTIKSFGPIKLTDFTFFNEQDSYFFTGFVPDGVITSVGNLVLYGVLSACLFALGLVMFEKKVRL